MSSQNTPKVAMSKGAKWTDIQDIDVWKVIYIKLFIGALFICICGTQVIILNWNFWQNFYSYLYTCGTLLLVAGACYFAGGLIGFLFGIPRMFQNTAALPETESRKRVISQNDNLVQISDWITKIIVGVGLTQLYNIPSFLLNVGRTLAPGLGLTPDRGSSISIVTILYFSIIGFLSVYLWTRLYFTKMLNRLELDLDGDMRKEIEGLKEANNRLQENLADVGGGKSLKPDEFSKIKSEAIITSELTENEFYDDPQKGKWGGASEANGRKISAIVTDGSIFNFYRVTITVESVDPVNNPLTGYVKFHLHNTFRNPDPVIAVKENKAVLALKMVYGAFTVGAEMDDGKTMLELDLSELEDAPRQFRER